MKKYIFFLVVAIVSVTMPVSARRPKTLHVVTTGDVHGAFFDRPYVEDGNARNSLFAVYHYVDSLRAAVGKDNVLLLDAGDVLQGDNATYYYNYVATDSPHIYPMLADYMGYDAVTVGNHDIETGHPVYDRISAALSAYGIPLLGGNVVRTSDGGSYFPVYSVFRKAGMKVLVLGFENANMKSWLSEPLWEGLDFLSLVPFVQESVDKAVAAVKPDVTVVVMHSGVGEGDGKQYESQGLDVFDNLHGVDLLVCSHDHQRHVIKKDDRLLLDAGSRSAYVGHAVITVEKNGGRSLDGEVVRMDRSNIDEKMRDFFAPQFEAVKAFTCKEVGCFDMPLSTREAYVGMCDYVGLVHTVQIGVPEAEISFAAPLTFNGHVKQGTVIFNDMFTIYPYENQMSVVRMTGSEIKNYLEYSYDQWIQTPGEHVLKIAPRGDSGKWSFVSRSYNFDSAAGINYTVDVTKPFGERIAISSLADGREFKNDAEYAVAMTSYRANGGGGLMLKGAGISREETQARTIALYPEIRELIYQYIKEKGTITTSMVNDASVVGSWKFVPEEIAGPLMDKDMDLVF